MSNEQVSEVEVRLQREASEDVKAHVIKVIASFLGLRELNQNQRAKVGVTVPRAQARRRLGEPEIQLRKEHSFLVFEPREGLCDRRLWSRNRALPH